MIETLARAAHRAELALNGEKNETVIEIDWELHGWRYIEGQKAALKALETPTPEMIEAGGKFIAGPVEYNRPTVKLDADATAWGAWKRMIRAAQEQGDG